MIHAVLHHGWIDAERYEAMRQRILEQRATPTGEQRCAGANLELLRFLDSYQRQHGYMPTNSEIATQFYGWTAKTGGVSFRLGALEHGGWITRGFYQARSIKITAKGRAALEEVT